MSNNLKNILLSIILISLCFMIKCKLDSDSIQEKKHVTTKSVSQIDSSKPASTPITEQVSDSNTNAVSTINDKKTALDDKAEDDTQVRKEEKKIAKPLKKPVKKVAPVKKTKTTKKPIKKTPIPKAKIEFEDMIWDFGEITEGDIVKKKFKFTNTGNAPLQIIGADASCGCARPTVPFLDIAPGESNEIGITYNSVNKEGVQKPEIIIESNTYPKHTVLKLSGTVKPKPKKEEKKIDSTEMKQDSTIKE